MYICLQCVCLCLASFVNAVCDHLVWQLTRTGHFMQCTKVKFRKWPINFCKAESKKRKTNDSTNERSRKIYKIKYKDPPWKYDSIMTKRKRKENNRKRKKCERKFFSIIYSQLIIISPSHAYYNCFNRKKEAAVTKKTTSSRETNWKWRRQEDRVKYSNVYRELVTFSSLYIAHAAKTMIELKKQSHFDEVEN